MHEIAEVFVDQDDLFARLGLPHNDENANQQFAVFMKAMRIYVEREGVRGSLWAQFDEHDAFHHMRSKLARIEHSIMNHKATIDDALDLMNYTAFLIRHIYGWKPEYDLDKPMFRTPKMDLPDQKGEES